MSGMDRHSVNERAEAALKIVGLERATHLYPYQLSGGMKHRVAVARAWALPNASVLLMDEPFSAIDAINRMTLQKYLVDAWLAEPRTVIYVTHDIDEAVYLADRIAIMTPSPGRVGQYVTVDMPRPRDRNSAQATALRKRIDGRHAPPWKSLETRVSHEDESLEGPHCFPAAVVRRCARASQERQRRCASACFIRI